MEFIFTVIGLVVFIIISMFFLYAKLYKKVDQGCAMIVSTTRATPIVTLTGRRLVIPVLHRMEMMDISLKSIDIDCHGKDGVISKDSIRADIKAVFFLRVNCTEDNILAVAQSIGCERASDQSTLEDLFSIKFSEALKTASKTLDFADLYHKTDIFQDRIMAELQHLNGYVLEDMAIDFLAQTPIENLDPNNIVDAQSIRRITELKKLEQENDAKSSNESEESLEN